MGIIKDNVAKIKNNPVGAVVGAGAGYLVATKLVKTANIWLQVGIAVIGGVTGALVQSKIKARKSQPTASTATTPAKK